VQLIEDGYRIGHVILTSLLQNFSVKNPFGSDKLERRKRSGRMVQNLKLL
jgi:hypothetical protein